jgi:hypothetical protein
MHNTLVDEIKENGRTNKAKRKGSSGGEQQQNKT